MIDDRRVVEKILRHLGAWHDPPPRPPPLEASGSYAYEPCEDVDPTPDYENVLTDGKLPPLRGWLAGGARLRAAPSGLSRGRRWLQPAADEWRLLTVCANEPVYGQVPWQVGKSWPWTLSSPSGIISP